MFNLLESPERKNALYLIRKRQRGFRTRFNEVFCDAGAGASLGQRKQHRPTTVGTRVGARGTPSARGKKNEKVCPLMPLPFPYIVEAPFFNAD
jgi:hypothetical protein